MDAIALVLIMTAALNLALAGVVLRAGAARETNRVFSAAATAVALWTLTNAGFRLAGNQAAAAAWAELSYGAGVLLGGAFLHFSWIYPQRRPLDLYVPSPRTKWMVWLVALAVAALAFAPGFMVDSVDLAQQRILTAPGVYLVAVYMAVTSALAFWTFYRSQGRLTGHRRAQARYVLYGSFLTAVFGLCFNLLLPLLGHYRWVWLGPASSLFFVGFTVYSIVAHRLFDVKILVRHTLAYSILLALLAGGFAALEKGMEHFVRPLLGPDDSFPTEIVAALVVGLGTEPLRRWAKGLAHRLLFKGEPDGRTED